MIGIIDSIALLDPMTKEDVRESVARKNSLDMPEALGEACATATQTMLYSVPRHTLTVDEHPGEIYCPSCGMDVTNYGPEWSYCPRCGQAIAFPEGGAE